MFKKIQAFIFPAVFLSLVKVAGAVSNLPEGQPVTLTEIESIVIYVARFLIVMGGIIAVMTFVVSGIIYMTAGAGERVKKAKAMFWNGIIGTLIVLGVGVIINTLAALVTRSFFCQISLGGICIY